MIAQYQKDFSSFDGNIWLNAGSEGPLPVVSIRSLQEAIEWKSKPYLLTNERFALAVSDLKDSIGKLINVDPLDVILGNSASYGLHLMANGIDWRKGDEILLMQNDFPSNILPWLALEKKGVKVIQIKPKERILTASEFQKAITKRTKLFCVSHVHTFSGRMLDIAAFGQICKEKNIVFVVNASHSIGTMPFDISKLAVDCVVCVGYKWLCGPYGTGFCWIKPEIREQLDINSAYWLSNLSAGQLQSEEKIKFNEMHLAKKFDVFGTANFFNFVPLRTSIDYFLNLGSNNVRDYQQRLIDRLLDKLDMDRYQLISSKERSVRSSLVVISHRDNNKNKKIHLDLLSKHIYTALWKNNIRITAHVYNSQEDIDRLIDVLHSFE